MFERKREFSFSYGRNLISELGQVRKRKRLVTTYAVESAGPSNNHHDGYIQGKQPDHGDKQTNCKQDLAVLGIGWNVGRRKY